MGPVRVRKIEIGGGLPKICAPIAAANESEILRAAQAVSLSQADIAEWRADWYEDILDLKKAKRIIQKIRYILGERPLLFTFRTMGEGGEKDISQEEYQVVNEMAAETGCVDLLDIEAFMPEEKGKKTVQALVKMVQDKGVKVIASNHDFQKTPAEDEIVLRLCKMQDMGADIAKIAVMPQNQRDVLTLLSATERMYSAYAKIPVITMSMDSQGIVSRLCGEIFGSALTFGTVGQASAPGQIPAEDLKTFITLLHKYMQD